jgi:hypothetical protein
MYTGFITRVDQAHPAASNLTAAACRCLSLKNLSRTDENLGAGEGVQFSPASPPFRDTTPPTHLTCIFLLTFARVVSCAWHSRPGGSRFCFRSPLQGVSSASAGTVPAMARATLLLAALAACAAPGTALYNNAKTCLCQSACIPSATSSNSSTACTVTAGKPATCLTSR